jgi:hypothetical protein
MSAKEHYLSNLKLWATHKYEEVQQGVEEIDGVINDILSNKPKPMTPEFNVFLTNIGESRAERKKLVGMLLWFKHISECKSYAFRSRLSRIPKWSLAGDLNDVATKIMSDVNKMSGNEIGTKDDRQLVYVLNPPRHGKSLLLDKLFDSDQGVCVLNVTYNAATISIADELESVTGAMHAFLLRLLCDLLCDDIGSWKKLWKHSPFEGKDTSDMVELFKSMVGITRDSSWKLLICIDEVSKLTDDSANKWSGKEEAEMFWRGLFSLTQSCTAWVRIVMTGFTDSPREAVNASDVVCLSYSLSMITNAENEVLCRELLWAYAAHNVPFPGLLWVLMKSTPGLLGLWAQQIDLCNPISKVDLGKTFSFTDNFSGLMSAVPWAAHLNKNAAKNWPLIRAFLLEDSVDDPPCFRTKKDVRNAEVATVLGLKDALSPFAVAITVWSLVRDPLIYDDALYMFLYRALKACQNHSAGCAAHCSEAWPSLVQRLLIEKSTQSTILTNDPRLQVGAVDILIGKKVNCFPGAVVENIEKPVENFVVQAIALRLQCLLERIGLDERMLCNAKLSDLVPPSIGYLSRKPPYPSRGVRHTIESSIAVSVCENPEVDIARLCTQTAALLLPSTISSILNGYVIDKTISRSKFFNEQVSPLNIDGILISYKKVTIADSAQSPGTFPAVVFNPNNDYELHNNLVNAMCEQTFDPKVFCTKHSQCKLSEVQTIHDDMLKVVELVKTATKSQAVVLFQPHCITNPLCDTVIVVPMKWDSTEVTQVSFILLELKDRVNSAFGEKLEKIKSTQELMLGPVAEATKRLGIDVVHVIYLLCGRNVVDIQQ